MDGQQLDFSDQTDHLDSSEFGHLVGQTIVAVSSRIPGGINRNTFMYELEQAVQGSAGDWAR